ncbi:MAG TPA: polyprenyl synthetase family protein [Candidatus Saccharimonadales bacterium]|nr:polyprenyl synthetase family protein [Candidatus Saccharimonadales bacterium]
MEFREYIALHRSRIHSKILEYLPLKEPLEYSRMIRDYPDRQGKYVRPGLLMLCGELFGAKPKDLILPAAVMQLSEDWILVHDDVEDDSDLRRGKPAIQKLYGMEQAINAGDALHMKMWTMLRDYIAQEGVQKGIRLFDKFYEILDLTVEGQYLDLRFTRETRQVGSATEKTYFDIVGRKTSCYSVYGPLQLGATVADQKDNVLKALKAIGSPAGTAFQIMDDILDVTANEKEFGKQRYGDLYEGKLTLLILHAYNHATRAERLKVDRIYKQDRRQKKKEEIDFLVYIMEKYGSVDHAYGVAMKYGEASRAAIDKHMDLLPNNDYRELFISAVKALFVRKK